MPTHMPPGPRGLRALRTQLSMLRDPLACFGALVRDFGDVVSFHIGAQPAVLISDPKLVDRVVRDRRFVRSRETRAGLTTLLGQGLLSLEGAPHLRHRRLMQPAFHRERIERYVAIMAEETYAALEAWHATPERDLREDMMRLTFAIVARCLFNTDTKREAARVDAILQRVLPAVNRATMLTRIVPVRPSTLLSGETKRGISQLHELVRDIVRQRRADGRDHGDLLSMLLASRDEDGSALSDEEIGAEALTILLAGHDTTAHTLTWVWYLLSTHPAWQQAVAAEVREVAADRTLEFTDLTRLPLCERVVREALRLYPPAWWADRVSDEQTELGGYRVPAGTLVIWSTYVSQRDARVFSEPERFDPDRFLPERAAAIPDGAYLPFGAGAHVCIGNNFALTEAKLILGAMAQRYELSARNPQAVRPRALITLGMAEPFPIIARARSANIEPLRQHSA